MMTGLCIYLYASGFIGAIVALDAVDPSARQELGPIFWLCVLTWPLWPSVLIFKLFAKLHQKEGS